MTDQPRIISVKQSDQHISQGEWLWGPDANGIACLMLEGVSVVGIYVPSLWDDKDESILPFE